MVRLVATDSGLPYRLLQEQPSPWYSRCSAFYCEMQLRLPSVEVLKTATTSQETFRLPHLDDILSRRGGKRAGDRWFAPVSTQTLPDTISCNAPFHCATPVHLFNITAALTVATGAALPDAITNQS